MTELNYARRIGLTMQKPEPGHGEVVFFRNAPPFPPKEYCEWAFHHIPPDENPVHFAGRIIGECPNGRCARKQHAPGICNACVDQRAWEAMRQAKMTDAELISGKKKEN